MTVAGLETLAGAAFFPQLTRLGLAGCGLDDEGMVRLASSILLRRIEELELGHNRITEAGALALARSENLGPLRKLTGLFAQTSHLGQNTFAAGSTALVELRQRFGDSVS